MTARNLKQQRSHHQPLARDELVSLVTRALANGQEEDILSELRLQRPDKFRRDKEPGSPTSPPSMTSDTSSLREYLLLHPNEADDGAPKGPPPPVPVNAPKGYNDGKGSRRGGCSNAPPGSASAGPAPPSTSSSWPSATSDAESTVSSSWMRSPAEAQGDVYILPVQSATALPRGVPTLAKWSRTLLVLPKFREKKWCYFDLLQQAWNDKEVMSYVKWIKNTYYTDAQKPVGGKASDLAAFLLATAFPIESRYQEICNSERIFVD